MNKLGRILLLVGGLVLAFLVGLLVGRGQRSPATPEGNAAAVQITTAPPPAAPQPLPAPVPPPPQAAAIPKPAPEVQVQEDAAAVGMTTREPSNQQGAPPDAGPAPHAPNSAPGNATEEQPIG